MPPGSPVGAAYECVDETVENCLIYHYWLEATDVEGQVALHGPVRAGLRCLMADPGLRLVPSRLTGDAK
jgi:hypothetical protein